MAERFLHDPYYTENTSIASAWAFVRESRIVKSSEGSYNKGYFAPLYDLALLSWSAQQRRGKERPARKQ